MFYTHYIPKVERVLTQDIWWGSSYELALELGPRSEESLVAAYDRLWSHAALDGPYPRCDREAHEQERLDLTGARSGTSFLSYGIATIPGGLRVACQTFPVREEDGPDWLKLGIPVAALDNVYPVWTDDSWRSWADPLEEWFADIGRFVYDRVPFALGVLGEEVSGSHYAEHLAEHGIPERHCGMLVPSEGGELRWLPATG